MKESTASPAGLIPTEAKQLWLVAARAAESKKAVNLTVLDLRDVTSFTDYFVICSGTNPRQIQAITDAILEQLDAMGERAISTEGYEGADWVLIDYGDYVIHVFSERAREYYDLERLWRHARRLEIPPAER